MTDWKAIQEEYVTGDAAMRSLAEKYGANYSTLRSRASRGSWPEKRREYRNTRDAQAAPQHVACSVPPPETRGMSQNAAEESEAPMFPGMEDVFDAARLMLKNIHSLLSRGVKAYEMRALSNALRDVREILQSRPLMDAEEQRARIDMLHAELREHEKNPQDNVLEIRFVGDVDECAQ